MPIQSKKTKRRRIAAPLGGLFIVFALIGIVTVVVTSIRLTTRFLDNQAEKERFADIIRPVAMFNPSPFEDPADIDMMSLLRYALWGTLKSDKRSSYEYEEFAELIIPAADFDVAAARLFGPDIELIHQSFGDYDVYSAYEEAENIYRVAISAQLFLYNPVVEEITKEGEYLRLFVAYIPTPTALNENPGPEKYMVYFMERQGDSYHIAKVQDPPFDPDAPLEGPVGIRG